MRDLTELRGTARVNGKGHRRLLKVIIGSESLVSHAGGALLVETARRDGLATDFALKCADDQFPTGVRRRQ